MDVGPVEYLIIGFPGSTFNGRMAPELGALIERGLIRVLDLVVVSKDPSGRTQTFEYDELDEMAPFKELEGDVGGILSEEDIAYAAASFEPGSSAALLLWENLWAAPLTAAVRDSGGVVLEGGRVRQDLADEALHAVGPAA